MKVNVGLGAQNSNDWDRFAARSPLQMQMPDSEVIAGVLELGDLAEPLGFDGLWAPEHSGTPYGMTPNPLQLLSYFAGRTEALTFGTMVAVAPWWHPIRLAHQIAYLDLLSKGRFTVVGLGRGVAKSEFDAVNVPREESRQRMDETLDILELAFTQEWFSYEGEIFSVPEMSIRPRYLSTDLAARFHGASATGPSLEKNAKRGLTPLFVGNKPITAAGAEVLQVNTIRHSIGLSPVQPKNVLFMYCTPEKDGGANAEHVLAAANRDVTLHYGFANPDNFSGVRGYEAYAERKGYATAVDIRAASEAGQAPGQSASSPGYDKSNLLVGTPEQIIERIKAAQEACSFSEITIVPNIGTMSPEDAKRSLKLFAAEVLPVVHAMDAPLWDSVIPSAARDQATV